MIAIRPSCKAYWAAACLEFVLNL